MRGLSLDGVTAPCSSCEALSNGQVACSPFQGKGVCSIELCISAVCIRLPREPKEATSPFLHLSIHTSIHHPSLTLTHSLSADWLLWTPPRG